MIAFARPAWCSGLATRWTGAKSTGLPPKTPGTITMKTATASIPVLLAVSRAASSCVELQGIVPGGGEGLLDLVVLLSPEESLGNPLGPLHVFSNPVVAGVSDAHRSFLFPATACGLVPRVLHIYNGSCSAPIACKRYELKCDRDQLPLGNPTRFPLRGPHCHLARIFHG